MPHYQNAFFPLNNPFCPFSSYVWCSNNILFCHAINKSCLTSKARWTIGHAIKPQFIYMKVTIWPASWMLHWVSKYENRNSFWILFHTIVFSGVHFLIEYCIRDTTEFYATTCQYCYEEDNLRILISNRSYHMLCYTTCVDEKVNSNDSLLMSH